MIADIDTGFGNAVNVAYGVARYAAAGVAVVVMEDKTFPKDSSLRPGGRQELVPTGEFQGKIEAARTAAGAPSWWLSSPCRATPACANWKKPICAESVGHPDGPTRFQNRRVPISPPWGL